MLVAAVICSISVGCTSSTSTNDPSGNISTLDSLIDRRQDIEREKLIRIADLKQKRHRAASVTDRYMANSLLFDEYITFQADSALKYIEENLDLAAEVGNAEWEAESKIDKAEVLAASGLLSQADELMQSIDITDFSKDALVDYYGTLIFLYSHIGNYTGGVNNDFYVRERAYKDSIMSVIDTRHPEYLWYKGWDILGTDRHCNDEIDALRSKLASSSLNHRQDAKDAYILAKLYEAAGDNENYKKYMALSAIVDVRTANAEIASLEDLAKIMFDEGDIDRAYEYINYSLNKAISYPNRVKAFSISETLDTVYNAYQERSAGQQSRMRMFLILVCVLAAVLIVAVVTIILQNIKLKRQGHTLDLANASLSRNNAELSEAQKQLNEANLQLKDLNENLRRKNEELSEANYVKEEYIGYVFTICSNYISKLENLKRDIHRKAIAKKYKEIEALTADLDMKDELKEFYNSFDSIFLHIYPNFVSDFNTLLQDDKKIAPKEGELLNTELRIYALVRLGITDSVKIAEFLHCSPQTVYNNRFKVRNKAIISKKEFADTVRTLGKYLDRTS